MVNHTDQVRALPIETAPRDGTIIRLLVEFEDHATEDTEGPAWTIGHNSRDNTGDDVWQFAGWCWNHDHYTEGKGKPVGWLPLVESSAPPSAPVGVEGAVDVDIPEPEGLEKVVRDAVAAWEECRSPMEAQAAMYKISNDLRTNEATRAIAQQPAGVGQVCSEDIRWCEDVADSLQEAGGPTNSMRLVALRRLLALAAQQRGGRADG